MLFERVCYQLGAITVEVFYFVLVRKIVRKGGSWLVKVASRRSIDTSSPDAVTRNVFDNLQYLNY